MASAARLAPTIPLAVAPAVTEVPDLAWTAGDWVEVERVGPAPVLAPVIDLDAYRAQPPARDRSHGRRRTAWFLALAVALLLAVTAGGRFADADPVDAVAGQTVVEPGETLWDVAVANAPEGVDHRAYLAEIRSLNGLTSATVPAWTVVLLPEA